MTSVINLRLTAGLALLLLAAPASAHYLWIETGAEGKCEAFFGEVQEGVREVSGGRLDEISSPVFSTVDAKGRARKASFKRASDRFVVSGAAGGRVLLTEANHDVQDLRAHGIGVVKPMFYARTENAGVGEPAHTLDVVPTGEKNQFRVFFRGAPLAKAKVMVYAPNLWMMERVADESGLVSIETPWPGLYVLDVVHKEPAPGRFKNADYEAVRHRATCSLVR